MKVLDEIEKVESDNKDRPIEPIEILCTEVFVDPFEKADEQIRLERERLRAEETNPSIDASLMPKNKREEEIYNAKQLQGTRQFYQAQSTSVAKYLADPAPQYAESVQSRKTNGSKRAALAGLGREDDEEESEHALKLKMRKFSRGNDLFEAFNPSFL